ncbi:sensor histidine kinase [Thalassotalea crassostreae]|uniref:sensor histidine kinase n=1 Tax=Thalassotalea crassostreae TaxID=1763536 RepID=UPI0012FDB655|nr:HAMP domain-containing sensor histidine kinase [Thalassotalea crassostreae]
MTNKTTASVYIAITSFALIIASLLIIEYKQNSHLLADNKKLVKDVVLATVKINISNELVQYPQNKDEFSVQWQNLYPNVWAFKDHKQFYPFKFNGTNKQQLSILWEQYETGKSVTMAQASQERINALFALKAAVKTKNNQQITRLSQQYFSLVENYQLSPLEEVISAIKFLSVDKESRWNDALIKQVALSGGKFFKPISFYLFRQNNQFSKTDIEHASTLVTNILESANIESKWFNYHLVHLHKKLEFALDDSLKNDMIIEGKYLLKHIDVNTQLFVPFNIEQQIADVARTLTKQGLLGPQDQISLGQIGQRSLIDDVEINIVKPSWQRQQNQQLSYFLSKIVLLLILTNLLILVSRQFLIKQTRKQQYLALREQFINMVSHELKTPLAAIRLMSETLDKRAKRELPIKDYPDRIVNEVDKLWLMVENLLNVNRVDDNGFVINKSKVNLLTLMKHCEEKFAHLTDKLVCFSYEIDPQKYIDVDQQLFELAISNLISNAIKYNDKNQVKIEIRYDDTDHSVYFIDNAAGIDKNDWHLIFEKFKRLNNPTSISGTGLGLTLVDSIIKRHHGQIAIVKSDENGTDWKIALER